MKWELDKPNSLTHDEWEDWHKENHITFPIRYFLQETIPKFLRSIFVVRIWWRIRDCWWEIKYRTIPKHQYHIIKPRTLTPNYYDIDSLILHSVMELLTRFVTGPAKTRIDWEATKEHSHAWKEMNEIYDWWVNKYPYRETTDVHGNPLPKFPKLPEEWGFLSIISERRKNEPTMIEWKKVSLVHNAAESEWAVMENEMLDRVINTRGFMWD